MEDATGSDEEEVDEANDEDD